MTRIEMHYSLRRTTPVYETVHPREWGSIRIAAVAARLRVGRRYDLAQSLAVAGRTLRW